MPFWTYNLPQNVHFEKKIPLDVLPLIKPHEIWSCLFYDMFWLSRFAFGARSNTTFVSVSAVFICSWVFGLWIKQLMWSWLICQVSCFVKCCVWTLRATVWLHRVGCEPFCQRLQLWAQVKKTDFFFFCVFFQKLKMTHVYLTRSFSCCVNYKRRMMVYNDFICCILLCCDFDSCK